MFKCLYSFPNNGIYFKGPVLVKHIGPIYDMGSNNSLITISEDFNWISICSCRMRLLSRCGKREDGTCTRRKDNEIDREGCPYFTQIHRQDLKESNWR